MSAITQCDPPYYDPLTLSWTRRGFLPPSGSKQHISRTQVQEPETKVLMAAAAQAPSSTWPISGICEFLSETQPGFLDPSSSKQHVFHTCKSLQPIIQRLGVQLQQWDVESSEVVALKKQWENCSLALESPTLERVADLCQEMGLLRLQICSAVLRHRIPILKPFISLFPESFPEEEEHKDPALERLKLSFLTPTVDLSRLSHWSEGELAAKKGAKS